jgi:hypothetical protein
MLFMVLNPIVIPFGAFYFFIEAGMSIGIYYIITFIHHSAGVVKNQVRSCNGGLFAES